MVQQPRSGYGYAGWVSALIGVTIPALFGVTDSALAQRRPIADETLGEERSRVVPLSFDASVDVIEGGARRGGNLFHSFREFNVDEGRSVYFDDPGVENILSRVTGNTRSEILGTLGVFGDANLFLINPNGIIFGEGASLDVRGSFVSTTADAIQFGDQGFFSASEPNAPPLLTVQPSAFLFNQLNPGAIRNNSIAFAGQSPSGANVFGLRVPDGQSLLLVGGNIILDGEEFGGRLNAFGGRVELGGLSEPGTVLLNADGSLGFPVGVGRSDVSLTNGVIDVVAAGGGNVAINARNLEILGESFIQAGIEEGLGTVTSRAGDITLNATENINVAQLSEISNRLYPNANGRGGNIRIVARSLFVTDGTQLITDTSGIGNAGDIIVDSNSFSISGIEPDGFGSGLYSQTDGSGNAGNIFINTRNFDASSGAGVFSESFSSGAGGNITIETDRLILRDGAQVGTSTFGGGQGGNLSVTASESVELSGLSDIAGSSQLFTQTLGLNAEAGGNLTIQTGQLIVQDRAQVSASTFGDGAGGNLSVTASESVELVGGSTAPPSGLLAESSRAGAGGNLTIQTGQLIVRDGALVSTRTRGSGSGGNLNVVASESVELSGASAAGPPSGLFSDNQGGTGSAGNLSIQTRQLTIRDGAQVQAGTFGAGQGGRLDVFALEFIEVSGTSPGSRPGGLLNEASGTGDAGIFTITTPQLTVRGDSAVVSASTAGAGAAGSLTIDTERLIIQDGGQVSAGTLNEGRGGNLNVTASELIEVSGTSDQLSSGLYTSATGAGNAGNMMIRTGQMTVQDGARVSTGTQGAGNAGDLAIDTERLVIRGGAQVGTGTFWNSEGMGGALSVNASESIEVSGTRSSLTSQTQGTGNAGDLTINTERLVIRNGAQVGTGTFNEGRGGDLDVFASESVELRGIGNNNQSSGLFAATEATGNAGDLTIETGQLIVQDEAEASVSSTGVGRAGNLEVTAGDILLNNQAELTAETVSGQGGGDIFLNADSVRLTNGAVINAQTFNAFRGGDVTIDADTFEVTGGGQVITTTTGNGRAGNIALNVTDRITLSGFDPDYADRPIQLVSNQGETSGLFANTAEDSLGQGGTIRITTGELEVSDRAGVVVNSQGSGVAGDIDISAQSVQLDRGRLTAETDAVDGGNITLRDSELLLLRNGSDISTTAGTDETAESGGDGGNITIDADFIVAFPNENSDIRANAFSGSGGRVDITTEGLFGIEAREEETEFSDITASSELGVQGEININTPDVDPSRGLTELPEDVVDASDQIAQTCPTDGDVEELGEFVVTGRGGLPANPAELLGGETVLSELAEVEGEGDEGDEEERGREGEEADRSSIPAPAEAEIVEAQGWVVGADGKVILTAENPAVEPHRSPIAPVLCPRS